VENREEVVQQATHATILVVVLNHQQHVVMDWQKQEKNVENQDYHVHKDQPVVHVDVRQIRSVV